MSKVLFYKNGCKFVRFNLYKENCVKYNYMFKCTISLCIFLNTSFTIQTITRLNSQQTLFFRKLLM